MTVRVLVACDGTRTDRPAMALDRCRGFLPVAGTIDRTMTVAAYAAQHGWVRHGNRDLCPACGKARAKKEATR